MVESLNSPSDYQDKIEPYQGPKVNFGLIPSNDEGLRGYQSRIKHEIYDLWNRVDNVMIQMPTGTGKTIVFTSIIKDILRWCEEHGVTAKILVVAHLRELIAQSSEKLGSIAHGIIQSGVPFQLHHQVQIASIQTFMSRKNYEQMRRINFGFIIIDEAHHSLANSYRKLWEMYPQSKKLGVTATPWRMNHEGFTSLYDDIILSKNIEWFVENKYLSHYDYVSIPTRSQIMSKINGIVRFGVNGDYLESELSRLFDKDHIRAQLYKSYCKFAKGKKGIIYAIDRTHAANICELYKSHGVAACLIDSTTPASERRWLISQFKRGVVKVLVNVNIFSEGFDCPDIEFIQLARPTKSLAMYLQQVGRGLRISKDKSHTIILDNVGLYNRFGTPMANRKWRYHFKGKDMSQEDFNDGTSVVRDIVFSERIPDYEEGNEEMVLIEHAVGNSQIRSKASEKALCLSDFNIFIRNGLYGVCNRNNRTIIPPVYEMLHPYCNGYIPFKQNGKWGILLGNGVVKVAAKYHYIGPFKDGIAEVRNTSTSPVYYINNRLKRIG